MASMVGLAYIRVSVSLSSTDLIPTIRSPPRVTVLPGPCVC
ncbi:MAG: hypothetical protein ACK55Z_19770 [bacterium]